MRKFLLLISILIFFNLNAQNKIKPKKLNEDFDKLITELKLQHQGLYEYVGKNSTDAKIDSVRNTLGTRQTKLEFYEKLRYVIGLTNEGHTSINLPKWSMMKLGLSRSFIPLTVKLGDGNLIITQNYGNDIPDLKKGLRIISVGIKG